VRQILFEILIGGAIGVVVGVGFDFTITVVRGLYREWNYRRAGAPPPAGLVVKANQL